jgi:hypothetical protein
MYLGDGHISRHPRTYALRIFLNSKNIDIVDRVSRAIETVRPHNRVAQISQLSMTVVTSYAKECPLLFPQHGPGRKHTRAIRLERWQRDVVLQYPAEFLRGCVESDGCRHRRVVKGHDYPAYGFSNRSDDIRSLFTWACDLIGIHWRQSNRWQISIARREDVARLDALFTRGDYPDLTR